MNQHFRWTLAATLLSMAALACSNPTTLTSAEDAPPPLQGTPQNPGAAAMLEIAPPEPGVKILDRAAEVQEVLDAMAAQAEAAWEQQVVVDMPDGSQMLIMEPTHVMVGVTQEDGPPKTMCADHPGQLAGHLHAEVQP